MNKRRDDPREQQMLRWLSNKLNLTFSSCSPASADASFRRYFRLVLGTELSQSQRAPAKSSLFEIDDAPVHSLIIMDAPPDKEPLDAFIRTTALLRAQGIHAPKIFAINHEEGFLVLEDFGSSNYLDRLQVDANALYSSAIDTLVELQVARFNAHDVALPAYSAQKLHDEMQLFEDWYVAVHLKQTLNPAQAYEWATLKSFLVEQCLAQPQVWVHRDFHSRNLMVLPSGSPGVIDYQDMVMGPVSYDLASLFKDCYIEWPRARQLAWLGEYHTRLTERVESISEARQFLAMDFAQLVRWYDLTGLQRHLKVLGIFCRLNYRDNKANYINDLPMVKRYILDVLPRYPQGQTFLSACATLLS